MKMLRKIFLSLAIASSMSAVSTSVYAEVDPGRITYSPSQAIDLTIEKIHAAIAVIDSGAEGEAVATAVKDALDMSKEINANDKVDVARSRANGHLKKARSAAKKGDLQPAEEHLRMGLKAFQSLKSLL